MRDNPKMPLAIHAAQTINEYNRIVQLYGMTPAHFLAEHGIIGRRYSWATTSCRVAIA